MPADVFIDFSRVAASVDVRAAIARLHRQELLGAVARRVTCAIAPENTASVFRLAGTWHMRTTGAIAACRDAIAAAAEERSPLLVLLGDIEPSAAALALLLEAADSDPMIGFATARLTGGDESSLACLDATGDRAIDELPRRLLAEIPESYLVADAPSRCLLIKAVVLANFGELDDRFSTLAGAIWHYMARARRCGFRTLVCNRAVVAAPCTSRPCPPSTITATSLPAADRVLLRELAPDVERTMHEYGTGTATVAETRLARALYHAYGAPPSLLLDLRNIIGGMNGTAMAGLGIGGGLHALRSGWDVTVVASKEAIASHKLETSFPDWRVTTKLPDRQFTAALRLSQPWHIQEMIDLHEAAAYNGYLFLDTIAWDTAYPAPRHLHGTWQFMADHADALLFISAYTRDRFRRRFQVRPDMPELVSYLAFDPADYTRPNMATDSSNPDSFIFIVGNDYDHKDVEPTMELLATAFPYESIVALGARKASTPRVKVVQNGALSEAEIHALYADARLVVFPSFYEGFGFPIVTTLAYGGTLLARQSPLLEEIAARSFPRGRVVPFADRIELVELVGRLLHGEDVATLPIGTAVEDGRPMSWQDVGAGIVAFLTRLTADLARSHWRMRERAIAQLLAAPTALTDRGLTMSRGHAGLPSS
jgi:glycosyltransferase involved in cell wall biosynthesis